MLWFFIIFVLVTKGCWSKHENVSLWFSQCCHILNTYKPLCCLDTGCVNNRKWLDMTSLKYYSNLELLIVYLVFWQGGRGKVPLWLKYACHFSLRIWLAGNLVCLKCIQSDLKNIYYFKNGMKSSVPACFCWHGLITFLKRYWLKLQFWVLCGDKDSGNSSGSFACVSCVDLDTGFCTSRTEIITILQHSELFFKNKSWSQRSPWEFCN